MEMNLQKYLAFVKTVELGSFTRAAEELSYSQSGISRMIGDLERDLDLLLLERGKGGVRPTSEGLRILPYARELCRDFQKLEHVLEDIKNLTTGLIRIGTFSSVATHWLPEYIKEFQRNHQGIDFELLLGDYQEIEGWILSGRVDCGFLRLPVPSGLKTLVVGSDRLMAVIPEDHPLAKEEVISVEALTSEPFMLLEKGENTEVSEIFRACGLSPHIRLTTWDDYAIMAMVESGMGVSVLPELILKRTPYRILAKPLNIPAERNIALAIRDTPPTSLGVKSFLEYLVPKIKGERGISPKEGKAEEGEDQNFKGGENEKPSP